MGSDTWRLGRCCCPRTLRSGGSRSEKRGSITQGGQGSDSSLLHLPAREARGTQPQTWGSETQPGHSAGD